VVKVTVDQSTNLVVNPASLSIPANGAASFTVKLANAPTAPVTVTVTTSTPDLTTTPASLIFTPDNFNLNRTVLVSTEPGAVPGAQSVLLTAGPLGQFNLPVTITPASNTTFFIDPVDGNDALPGTAAQPWKTVWKVLDVTERTGFTVATTANAGNDVVVTILGRGTDNVPALTNNVLSTQILSAGSVTVLQDPFPKTFTLNMGNNRLILNKGYKLQGIKIESTVSDTLANGGATAVLIKHPTAGLANVEVKCDVTTNNTTVKCVEVREAGSHILRDVRVDVADAVEIQGGNVVARSIGILNNDASVSLSIIGGRVRPIAPPVANRGAITLIDSQGVLAVTGVEVDMTNDGHAQNSIGINLQRRRSSVTNSTIKVCNAANATGIKVQPSADPSTVDDNEFIGPGGNNGIGVDGRNFLSSFRNNTFGQLGTNFR
jgi:hypothetical protein